MRRKVKILFILYAAVIFSCSGSEKFHIPDPLPDDRLSISPPEEKEINVVRGHLDKQVVMPLENLFKFSRIIYRLNGNPKQAMNINAFDEVPNSSWFTNRNAFKQMTLQEIARGPNTGNGPDTKGIWTIKRAKVQGVTPGFHIKDSKGDRYLIKFDPPGYIELNSGAEIVSTKLFHAIGYNVPENYVVYFDPDILKIDEDVEFTDKEGKKRLMKKNDLDEILKNVNYTSDGGIRATASKYIDSKKIIGPFRYEGTRDDDPNDIVPHEHRRELRGLRIIAAWLNHFDTKANNSLDVYVTENQRSYIKHYLIDFGSTLGSAAEGPMPAYIGFENMVDPNAIFVNFITLGLKVRPYEKSYKIKYPSIGHIESKNFSAHDYKFICPNPAFANMTNRDGFWAAKLIMSFTDEQLKTAVEQGQYSSPEAAAYLLKILIERRNIIGRYWFSRMNPLDKFEIREKGNGKQELYFVDLAVDTGLESKDQSSYKYLMGNNKGVVFQTERTVENPPIPLPDLRDLTQDKLNRRNAGDEPWGVKIMTKRNENGNWSKWIKVFMGIDEKSGKYVLFGIKRQEKYSE
ncbi:hypothetical protein ACFL40_01780 [candidate division KSB1 bacterium]